MCLANDTGYENIFSGQLEVLGSPGDILVALSGSGNSPNIVRAIEAAQLAKDRLGVYLVLGVLASFTFQVVYNVTMSAGLAPVKGLTLPLMSYGGSSMIATLAGFGLILNVRMRRFTN